MNKDRAQICVVDDNRVARETLSAILRVAHYEVITAESGSSALELLERTSPDVILLDVIMPDIGGIELCTMIKSNPEWKHIPIILITAEMDRDLLIEGLNAGADEFLIKPVGAAELRARISTMLRIKYQYDALQATLTLREDLANMIVHDIRSPLSAAILYSQMIERRGVFDEKAEKHLKIVQTQLNRINSFLGDMLVIAKMERGKLLLSVQSVDVNKLIKEVAEVYNHVLLSSNRHLKLDLGQDIPLISADPNLFRRVIDNLLSNATRFAPPSTSVTVQTRYDQISEVVIIKVEDEGKGIEVEHRERIFDRYEVVSVKNEGFGVGLGLAFCKMVTEAHGGEIWVEDNTPHGAVFFVKLRATLDE